MKKIIILFVCLCFITACAGTKSYQPVATLEELSSKEEIDERKNWVTSSGAKNAGYFAAGLLGGLVFGIPIAAAIASIPDEKDLTLCELADTVAVKAYDAHTQEYVFYSDGAMSSDYAVLGINVMEDETIESEKILDSIGVLYIKETDDENKIYCEVRMIVQTHNKTYWEWRIPMLKRQGNGDLVYALNENWKVKEPVSIKGREGILHITFTDELNGNNEIIKTEAEILPDFETYFLNHSCPMEDVECPHGDDSCGEDI